MKKITMVFVVVLMAFVLVFTGCNRKSGSAGQGPVKITVELFDRGTDGGRTQVDNNAWTDWIKEKVLKDLNIEVTFFPVGRWSENTDIVNLMASGSAPDLCYTYAGDMVAAFRDQGGILDLAPHLGLLPDARKLLGADPVFAGKDFIMRNQQPDGKMYSIPSYRVALAQRNIFIREDWLSALGLRVPTTMDEFHDALVAFRDRDPGNVGRSNVIPLMQGDDARWGLANFMNSFITPNLSDLDRFSFAVAERNILFPGYKEGVRLMNQWYNEGLIFHDFPLIDNADDGNNIIKSGVAGAFSGNWDLPYRGDSKLIEDMRLNVPGANFVPVDIGANRDMMDKVGLQVYVPAFSKNAEAALQYLNWLCIRENLSFLQIGNPGVNHNLVDGVPSIVARPANDPWFQNSAQNIDMTPLINGIELGSDDLNARVLALSYSGFPAEVIVNAYAVSTNGARAPVVINLPLSEGGIYAQTLQDKATALLAQSITATPANFDRIWDAGVQDWLQSGAQIVMDERRRVGTQAGLR